MDRAGEHPRETVAALSAAYRDLATEKTPGRLDARVLDAARQQAGRGAGGRRPAAWYRSFPLVAGIGLCAVLAVGIARLADVDNGGARVDVIAPDAPGAGRLLPVETRCSEEERSTSSRWWRCVRELERRGQTGAAEAELQALLGAYPGFVEPE